MSIDHQRTDTTAGDIEARSRGEGLAGAIGELPGQIDHPLDIETGDDDDSILHADPDVVLRSAEEMLTIHSETFRKLVQ